MDISDALKEKNEVAPFTGAWIEIFLADFIGGIKGVAPFTGAWIEIDNFPPYVSSVPQSHPSRVRGLKWDVVGDRDADFGASHPSRVRGLKFL